MDLVLDQDMIDQLLRSPDLSSRQKLALLEHKLFMQSLDKNSHIEEAEIVSETKIITGFRK